MADKIREALAAFNAAASGDLPFSFDFVDPKEVDLLKKNARYMDNPTFSQLVENVRRDNQLTSVPLCTRDKDGKLTVISGNHRIQAAAMAGVGQVVVMVLNQELSREEMVSRQLSHNSLAGRDDMVVLRELWMEIEDISWKEYSGLDSATVQELEKMECLSVPSPKFEYETMQFVFLPEDTEALKKILEDVEIIFSGDEIFLAAKASYEQAFSLITQAKKDYKIINSAAAFAKILDLASEKMRENDQQLCTTS